MEISKDHKISIRLENHELLILIFVKKKLIITSVTFSYFSKKFVLKLEILFNVPRENHEGPLFLYKILKIVTSVALT